MKKTILVSSNKMNMILIWSLFMVWLLGISGCNLLAWHNDFSSNKDHLTLKNYYATIQDTTSYLNGTIYFIENGKIWQVEAFEGYILSNSKKFYKDSVLLYWIGEDYIQENPISYNQLFCNNYALFLNPIKRNFECHYYNNSQLLSLTVITDTNPHCFDCEFFSLAFSKNKEDIKLIRIYHPKHDTVMWFSKGETLKKMIISNHVTAISEVVRRPITKEGTWVYNYSHLITIVNKLDTTYRIPIIKNPRLRAWNMF